MKSLWKIQQEHKEWERKNFPEVTVDQLLIGVMEELGELSHAHLKESVGIRTNEDHVSKAKDSIGDIIIFLIGYCSLRGFCIDTVLNEAWEEVSKRNWKKDPVNGGSDVN